MFVRKVLERWSPGGNRTTQETAVAGVDREDCGEGSGSIGGRSFLRKSPGEQRIFINFVLQTTVDLDPNSPRTTLEQELENDGASVGARRPAVAGSRFF